MKLLVDMNLSAGVGRAKISVKESRHPHETTPACVRGKAE